MNRTPGLYASHAQGELYYRTQKLYTRSWLPQVGLVMFCLCLMLVLFPVVPLPVLAATGFCLAGLWLGRSWASHRFSRLQSPQKLGWWYMLALCGALLCGVLQAAVLVYGLLHADVWQHTLLLAALLLSLPLTGRATSACWASFLAYTAPVVVALCVLCFIVPGQQQGQPLALLYLAAWAGQLWARYWLAAAEQQSRWQQAPDGHAGATEHMASLAESSQVSVTRKQLEYLMRHDGLTGLMNRGLFRQTVQERIAGLEQRGQGLLVLMCLDLDRFKVLNESLGGNVGDEILRQVSRRLQHLAAPVQAMARSAGDEFMLLWTGLSSQAEAEAAAERILQGLRQPFILERQELLLSLSMGLALLEPGRRVDADVLLSQAGQAWRHAKYLGGDRYQLYHTDLPLVGAERLVLEQQMRRGLKEGHFQAFYQPKVRLVDGLPYAVEALARWVHPERGMISPAEFIPLAEETGLIGELSEQIFFQACRQAQSWHAQGMPVQVSVNLSAQHLRGGSVLGLVRRILEETGLPAALLELELTESQLPDDLEQLVHILKVFHLMGVQVAIDDFGTGYSSLSYLKRLPVSGLKIDQSFIREMTTGSRDVTIVRSIISLAHSLDLHVVAEGVETREQMQLLKTMECDAIQGYYIARPMPAQEVTVLLNRQLVHAADKPASG